MRTTATACIVVLVAASLAGCAKKDTGSGTSPEGTGTESVPSTGKDFGTTPSANATSQADLDAQTLARMERIQGLLQDVFFDFDKDDIRSDAKAALTTDVRVLRDEADIRVFLEGHCDERGTNEYNLALGERRARAVKNYLVQAGISADRLFIISYGEEKPFAMGHGEESWQLNRRTHFKVRAR